jgi:hypothetical protein
MDVMKASIASFLGLGLLGLGALGCNGKDSPADLSTAGSNNLLPAEVQIPGALGRANPPDFGERIDRAGRPAITAALISPFSGDPDTTSRDRAAYNAAGLSNPNFKATMKTSLAILDGLDGKCGNQLLAGSGQDRYDGLTNVLLDDQLYINSDRSGSVYLGVELEFVTSQPGFTGTAIAGAGGGRQPGDDVIARSYSELAAGIVSGIDDGVPNDDAVHDPERFPFIAAPQQ